MQGSWNKNFNWIKNPTELEIKNYAYEIYKRKAGYYQAFVVGASVYTQEYIDHMTDFEYRIFQEALDDRIKYEEYRVLPRRIIL